MGVKDGILSSAVQSWEKELTEVWERQDRIVKNMEKLRSDITTSANRSLNSSLEATTSDNYITDAPAQVVDNQRTFTPPGDSVSNYFTRLRVVEKVPKFEGETHEFESFEREVDPLNITQNLFYILFMSHLQSTISYKPHIKSPSYILS